MEPSRNSVPESRQRTGLGRCRHFFWLGVVFDTVGATVLFTGVFSDLLFYDLLLYLGSIIIFLSLLWWVFWYTGNVKLSPEEALKAVHVPSAVTMDAENRPISSYWSLSLNVTTTLARIRRGQRRRRMLQRTASVLSSTILGRIRKRRSEEEPDKNEMKNVESGGAEDVDGEDLRPEPEAVRSPGPDAGTLDLESEHLSTHPGQPELTSSPVDRPPPPAIVASKSLPVDCLSSARQPLAVVDSKNQPVVSLASTRQPLAALASRNLPAVPLSSTGQPLDTLSSKMHTAASVAPRSYPLASVAAQSHFQNLSPSQNDFQNLSLASQTQPPPVQAPQTQALATQVSLVQLQPASSSVTQPVDLKVTPNVHDFQSLCYTQQASCSAALVQELAISQSSHAQEPPAGQELSQEVPGTVSSLPRSLALATKGQESMPHESVPAPTTENRQHL
ncbi:PREDICTED: transmembrane protein 238 [Miniopterus natalensis]|uniref:transmembrane protein 238 n=1 Tax=Miniopterus natalensis TaxID=291302 RepID=UPI0007A6F9AC|nr:PREDICTED: transmembrane protein 238 [Miniopterus natalensis]